MISYLIDQIPWWIWLVGALMCAGALFYFFSPILIPIWRMIPTPVRIALAGIGAALLAYFAGRNKGNDNAKADEQRRNAQAESRREAIHQDVKNTPASDLDKRLDRYYRDD